MYKSDKLSIVSSSDEEYAHIICWHICDRVNVSDLFGLIRTIFPNMAEGNFLFDYLGANGFGSSRFFEFKLSLNKLKFERKLFLKEGPFDMSLKPSNSLILICNQVQANQIEVLKQHSVLSASELAWLAEVSNANLSNDAR